MSTRSAIIVKRKDQYAKGVYCHYDGYLNGIGRTLLRNFDTPDKVEELVCGGDIRCIESNGNVEYFPRNDLNRGVDLFIEMETWNEVAQNISHNNYIYYYYIGMDGKGDWYYALDDKKGTEMKPLVDWKDEIPEEEL